MAVYAFTFQGDTLLLEHASAEQAKRRAYLEVAQTYEIDPDRLDRIEWPTDGDYVEVGSLDEPVFLEGVE